MTVEFFLGGFIAAFGLMAIVFSRQLSDFLVAGNYVISAHRGAVMNASQRPWSTRLLGGFFVAFGAFTIITSALAPNARKGPQGSWELGVPLVGAVILALVGLAVLFSRRRLTTLAAQRLTAHAGDIYPDPEVARYARMFVSTLAGWAFVLAAILCAVGVIIVLRP